MGTDDFLNIHREEFFFIFLCERVYLSVTIYHHRHLLQEILLRRSAKFSCFGQRQAGPNDTRFGTL